MSRSAGALEEEDLPDPSALSRLDPQQAARALGGPEDFPDLRHYNRLPKIIQALSIRLRAPSMPQVRRLTRGASRWFHNRRLSGRKMLARLFAVTGAAVLAQAPDEELVVACDSSEIDRHGRGVPDDAGPLRSPNARGYMMHLAVAVTVKTGSCLGALTAWAWTRNWDSRAKQRRSRSKAEKESSKWDRGIERVERSLKKLGFKKKVTYVEDREADDYEHLANQAHAKRSVIVRHDFKGRPRQVQAPASAASRKGRRNGAKQDKQRWILLRQKLDALPYVDKFDVAVDSRAHDRVRGVTHHKREATVSLRFCSVVMKPPRGYKGRHFREGLPLSVVEVKERNPPPGVEPLHWVLFSLDPVNTPQEARAVVHKYKLRWKVEDYIKVAKSACRLEAQHVDDLASFTRLMAVALAMANQLVQLIAVSRTEPATPARDLVDESTFSAIRDAAAYHEIVWPRGRVSVSQLIELVARIGGYETRKDRKPGFLVITRGWARIREHRAIVEHDRRRRGRPKRARVARTSGK